MSEFERFIRPCFSKATCFTSGGHSRSSASIYTLIERNPPGGVFYLLCSLIKGTYLLCSLIKTFEKSFTYSSFTSVAIRPHRLTFEKILPAGPRIEAVEPKRLTLSCSDFAKVSSPPNLQYQIATGLTFQNFCLRWKANSFLLPVGLPKSEFTTNVTI